MKRPICIVLFTFFLCNAACAQWILNNNQLEDKSSPTTPTNLIATGYSDSEIYLTWDDVTDETDYYIFCSFSSGTPFFMIDSTIANVTYYYHQGLMPQSQYCYMVTAYNQDGSSNFSNEACVSTLSSIIETILNINQISISPNPTTGKIKLQISPQFGQIKTLEIYNCMGQLQTIKTSDFADIDINGLASGLYFIVLTNDKHEKLATKVVKE